MTCRMPATGMASSAPKKPSSSTPSRMAMVTVSADSWTVRDMMTGWSRWFSACW